MAGTIKMCAVGLCRMLLALRAQRFLKPIHAYPGWRLYQPGSAWPWVPLLIFQTMNMPPASISVLDRMRKHRDLLSRSRTVGSLTLSFNPPNNKGRGQSLNRQMPGQANLDSFLHRPRRVREPAGDFVGVDVLTHLQDGEHTVAAIEVHPGGVMRESRRWLVDQETKDLTGRFQPGRPNNSPFMPPRHPFSGRTRHNGGRPGRTSSCARRPAVRSYRRTPRILRRTPCTFRRSGLTSAAGSRCWWRRSGRNRASASGAFDRRACRRSSDNAEGSRRRFRGSASTRSHTVSSQTQTYDVPRHTSFG